MVTVKKLKLVVSVKSVILFAVIGGIFYSSSYFYKIKSRFSRQERTLKSEVHDYQSKIDSFNAKTRDIAASLETWDDLTAEKSNFGGLKISEAKKVLDGLREAYKFKNLDVELLKPNLLGGEFKRQTVGVESSNITIKILGYSDVQLLNSLMI